jgi:lipoate-protein ligase A
MNVLLEHGHDLTGSANMARDLELLHDVRSGTYDIALRTYTWSPWCVSLGKHQRAESIDHDALSQRGWDLVHRPTGGRAVLHANELTYCIVVPLTATRTASDVYQRTHELLLAALQDLVPDLSFERSPSDLQHHYATAGATAVSCFTSSARTEIMVQGRKVVGSAQRVIDGIVLQHGSILCGPGHEQLADVIVGTPEQRVTLARSMQEHSTTLSEVVNRTIDAMMCQERIFRLAESGLSTILHP